MSNIRASGYFLQGPDDDESFQMLIGDVERLAIQLNNTILKASEPLKKGSLSVAPANVSSHELLALLNGSIIPIQAGGTGANNAEQARINLGITLGSLGALALGDYTQTGSYTSGSGNHGIGSDGRFMAILVAGGAGGMGGPSGSGSAREAGAGGGAGEMVYCFGRVPPGATVAYSVGAGGTGGASGGNLGNAGGSSTITYSSETLTAHGGRNATSRSAGGDGGGPTVFGATWAFPSWCLAVRIPGDGGTTGGVALITYSGASFTSYALYGGDGGSGPGSGGSGSGATSTSGADGSAGRIYFYEPS